MHMNEIKTEQTTLTLDRENGLTIQHLGESMLTKTGMTLTEETGATLELTNWSQDIQDDAHLHFTHKGENFVLQRHLITKLPHMLLCIDIIHAEKPLSYQAVFAINNSDGILNPHTFEDGRAALRRGNVGMKVLPLPVLPQEETLIYHEEEQPDSMVLTYTGDLQTQQCVMYAIPLATSEELRFWHGKCLTPSTWKFDDPTHSIGFSIIRNDNVLQIDDLETGATLWKLEL